jgi:hypothetical protein
LVAPGASAPAFLAPRSSTHLGIEAQFNPLIQGGGPTRYE